MSIETLSDIAEEMADHAMIYGSCECPTPVGSCEKPVCRPVFVSELVARMRAAAEIERKLGQTP